MDGTATLDKELQEQQNDPSILLREIQAEFEAAKRGDKAAKKSKSPGKTLANSDLSAEELGYSKESLLKALRREAIEAAEREIARRAENVAKSYFVGKKGRAFMREAARRATLRFFNFAFAATIVGIIVTYIIMSIQYIGGNLMHKRWVPKLTLIERMVYWCVNILMLVLFIFMMVIIILILSIMANPIISIFSKLI